MKFLKHFISILLVSSMLFGCELVDTSDDLVIGNYTTSETTFETEEIQSETMAETTVNDNGQNFSWDLRELWLYSVDSSMYTEAAAPDGSPLLICSPSVTYSYREVLNFLSDNAYIKRNYSLAETSRDNSTYAPFGEYGQHANASIENIVCGQKIDKVTKENEVVYSDILISVGQEYNTYSKPNYFSVLLNSTAVDTEFQQMLYELLSSQVGEEIAEYAVYAKTQKDDQNEFDLIDVIPTVDGRGNLHIKRTISGGAFMLELDFRDSAESDETRYAYYDHHYDTVYNESRFTLADVFLGDFGGNNPANDAKFFDKFMEIGGRSDTLFTQSVKNSMSTIVTEGVNKVYRNYHFGVDLTKGCNMPLEEAPTFNCNIDAYFDSRTNTNYVKGDGNFIVGYTAINACTEDEAFTELVDAARAKIYCLFPSIDTSGMTYENFYKKAYNAGGHYTVTSSKIPVNVDVHVELKTKYLEEMDTEGNIKETDTPVCYYAKVNFALS